LTSIATAPSARPPGTCSSHSGRDRVRRSAIYALEALGISVEFSHHEVAPGQQEIDLRYADALSTADNVMSFRHIIKEVAISHGVHATFMPKPFGHQPGSGMHTHLSLFEGDRNAFHDPADELFLSATARSFIAGLLRHAREITAVTNQWVNSYKRLFGYSAPGQIVEAPTYVCWGHANRSALVRVPMYKPGKANSTRVEVRSPDSACNPYLAFAVLLAAGLKGVEQGYELPPGAEDDVWSLSDTERRALGYDELPRNLADALTAMESSQLVAETLGEHVFEFFLRNKRAEWVDYRAEVTPFELRRGQRLLPPRRQSHRPACRAIPKRDHGAHPGPRLLGQPGGDLLLDHRPQAALSERLHRPRRGRAPTDRLRVPLQPSSPAIPVEVHHHRPRRPPGTTRPARTKINPEHASNSGRRLSPYDLTNLTT